MTLSDIIEIAQAYRDLGDAIGEQISAVVADPTDETVCEQNANALRIADEKFLSTIVQVAGWQTPADTDLLAEVEQVRAAIAGELV